ncbi:MAG: 50S ribosomal protein L23 [Acidiferrobacterales bacterium]
MNDELLYQVLLAPYVSEKSTRVAEKHRQFVFRVRHDATKPLIKQAVEKMFDVKVEEVKVLNIKGKYKMFGRRIGRRPNSRKAYVRLKPGYDIDFLTTS